MKKILLTAIACGALLTVAAQSADQPAASGKSEGYRFPDQKTLPVTSVKDQSRSGTCWCFSTIGLIESEILRAGGESLDLSEMWVVRNLYLDKAEKYVRMHGNLTFAEGGEGWDVFNAIRKYGIVPQEVYPGFNYGTDKPDFSEISPVLESYMKSVVASGDKSGKLSTAWKNGFNAILDAYFGVMPEKFTYNSKEYTPQSFAASLPINLDDYVDITSFTHHPFYTQFMLEIPDNWEWCSVWNLPMDEMMAVIDNALANGYTVEWGTDVSEKGFSRTKGIGVIPVPDSTVLEGTDAARWGKLTQKERDAMIYGFDKPRPEMTITQEMRQEAFDNYQTTDDHGMLIMGTATDQNGTPYYKVKNSWNTVPPFDGYWYFSRPFVEYKTTGITVNKNALPKDIAKNLL